MWIPITARDRAFSSESLPGLDPGWNPVRVKKTRQINESRAPLRFHRSAALGPPHRPRRIVLALLFLGAGLRLRTGVFLGGPRLKAPEQRFLLGIRLRLCRKFVGIEPSYRRRRGGRLADFGLALKGL